MDGIQLSMFDMIPAGRCSQPVWEKQSEDADWFTERFRESVHRGSGFSGSKLRIFAAAELKDKDRLADFIQQEYSVGGNSIRDGFCDYNNRGMTIRNWKSNEEKRYPWHKVRDEVLRQIWAGEFLTQEEMEKINVIRERNGGVLSQPSPRMQYEEEKDG